MKPQKFTTQYIQKSARNASSGFTIIETLIGGLIIASVMTGVGKLGISAMATSRNQSKRNTIEAAINNHIQLVQMEDSYLTKDAIENESGLNTSFENDACKDPSTFLRDHLKKTDVAGESPNPTITMIWDPKPEEETKPDVVIFSDDSDSNLLILTYQFEAPEASVDSEIRIAELNPNFASQCYDLQQ